MKAIKGGEFIIRKTNPEDIFTPEDFNEEQRMIAQMCDDFLEAEIAPNLDAIDAMTEGLMPSILEKAGELGLLGLTVPENLGGMGIDFSTSLLASACGSRPLGLLTESPGDPTRASTRRHSPAFRS
jgi:alkylation response protein AidB-like acyl-CoA dehydrogenase